MKKPTALILMVLVGALCLLYVGIKIDMWRMGYELEDLERQRVLLKRQQEALQVQVSKLTDPQQIAHRAGWQLGFAPPQEGQVVMVSLDVLPSDESGEHVPVRLVQSFADSRPGWP
jgi:cell division protein FtsL